MRAFLLWLWDTRALHTLAALTCVLVWWRVNGARALSRLAWALASWQETQVTAGELRRIRRDYAITDEQQQDGWR